jgi:hypothetical protein
LVGQLTGLEGLTLCGICEDWCNRGIAQLQHLTGLTSLTLDDHVQCGHWFYLPSEYEYPEVNCNFTALKELRLESGFDDGEGQMTPNNFVVTLPAALGNLTNLESLYISMWPLRKLPESLDDLFWRKAHEEGDRGSLQAFSANTWYFLLE